MFALPTSAAGTLAFVLAACSCGAAADSILLKPKHVEGRVTYRQQVDDSQQTISGGPAEAAGGMKATSKQTFGVLEKVEKAGPDKTVLSLTYEHIAMSGNYGPAMKYRYDSDWAQQPQEGKQVEAIFKPVLGASVRVELGPDGRATSASGMKELAEKVRQSAGNTPLSNRMRNMFTDEALMGQTDQVHAALYANKEVKPGDAWTNRVVIKTAMAGDLIYTYDCKLKGIEKRDGHDVGLVEFAATIVQAAATASGPAGVRPKLIEGAVKGEAVFDAERGQFTQVHADIKTTLELNVAAGAGGGNAMKIASAHKMDLTVLTIEEREKQKAEAAKQAPAAEKHDEQQPGSKP